MEYPHVLSNDPVDGLSIFYREAGPRDALSYFCFMDCHRRRGCLSRSSRRLPIAIIWWRPTTGFGHSDWPDPKTFAYTFDNYAEIMTRFTEALSLYRYTLYMQDYGGPVGFRMALAHPERIEALIVRTLSHTTKDWEPIGRLAGRSGPTEPRTKAPFAQISCRWRATRTRHVGNDPNVERYDPDLWSDEFGFLSQPGQADIQSDLFYDYRTNVDAYPKWQAWMRERQPRLLVIWGKYDMLHSNSQSQKLIGGTLPKREYTLLDAGHFALDTAADEIAVLVRAFGP